eukprot:483520-Amphidinium_carterae.1
MADRKYFLLKPNSDLTGCAVAAASYADSAVGSQALWRHAALPSLAHGRWSPDPARVLPVGAGRFWSPGPLGQVWIPTSSS